MGSSTKKGQWGWKSLTDVRDVEDTAGPYWVGDKAKVESMVTHRSLTGATGRVDGGACQEDKRSKHWEEGQKKLF